MCKGPRVGMRLVCCDNRKKVQFSKSRVSEGQVEGQVRTERRREQTV